MDGHRRLRLGDVLEVTYATRSLSTDLRLPSSGLVVAADGGQAQEADVCSVPELRDRI